MSTVVLLDELENIETHIDGISNAYMNTSTTEKIVFNTGTEFNPFRHAGQLLLIKTALYGLRSSGSRFNYRLSDTLPYIGFVHSMGGCGIWMRN